METLGEKMGTQETWTETQRKTWKNERKNSPLNVMKRRFTQI